MSKLSIIEFDTSDGLPENCERKLNWNFKNLIESFGSIIGGTPVTKEDVDRMINDAIDPIKSHEQTIDREIDDLQQTIAPPVGTYLYCENNPQSYWPNTIWKKITDGGVFLMTDGEDAQTGETYSLGSRYGESKHKLTAEEMPEHSHSYPRTGWVKQKVWETNDMACTVANDQGSPQVRFASYTGGDKPHNNIPQAIACHCWKRTS